MQASEKQKIMQDILEGFVKLSEAGPIDEPVQDILMSDGWADLLYAPTCELKARLNDYFEWCKGNEKDENPGELLEEIAFLLFKSLRGVQNIRSYTSYSSQHDLVVDGSSTWWSALMICLHLPLEGRTIVVECKNEKKKLNDQQFSRLCGILQNKFGTSSHLGVFISRQKATGFPDGKRRIKALSEARATQVIFHAKTKKNVVVVDHQDLERIANGFSFPKLLEAKIREIEASYGREILFDGEWEETKLPRHLQKYMA